MKSTAPPVANALSFDAPKRRLPDDPGFAAGAARCPVTAGTWWSERTLLLHCLRVIARTVSKSVPVTGLELADLSLSDTTYFRILRTGVVSRVAEVLLGLVASKDTAPPFRLSGFSRSEPERQGAARLDRFGSGGRDGTRPDVPLSGERRRIGMERPRADAFLLVCAEEARHATPVASRSSA